jgi:acetolactate synthase-1/2/3 large subunit
MDDTAQTITAGGAILSRLKAVGVDYIFANSGTDFPPIIEGLAEANAKDIALPKALVIPHEHAALGMAHGYYLATGRAQAVMAHTNVGLANCVIGAINAATEHVPVLLFSGRTPTVEQGRFGARTVPIGWGQEMRDQTALVREVSKWDYELRFPEQALEVVDRAYAIACSTPQGPVYVSLPREVLCGQCPSSDLGAPSRISPVRIAPDPDAVKQAAALLAAAERPLIVTQRGAGSAFGTLSALALDWGIPVSQYWAVQLGVPTDHPMSLGQALDPWLAEADAVLVLDCLAPWSPEIHKLAPGCKVIQAGPDPLYSRFPIRNFHADIALAGETSGIVFALAAAMGPPRAGCAERRARVADWTSAERGKTLAAAERGSAGEQLTKARVSLCLSRALESFDASVLSELGCPMDPMTLRDARSWYQEPHSGGLGWSFPCALGMALADPDRLAVATMGDGSYMFSNPVACHQIAEALNLPVLVVILNNREWGAVRRAVTGIYPDGFAVKNNQMPLVSLAPTPDFTKVAQASRAWAARVDQPDDLPGVLAAALAHVRETRTQALVEVSVAPG